jgi:excisionase family DNA binding protein
MSEPMSVAEAAAEFGVSERTIWRWLQSGRLTAERHGERVQINPAPDPSGHAVAEARVAYGPSSNVWPEELQPGPWPYTPENIQKRKAILASKRRHAAERIAARALESKPDPDGLTGVDYIRELRGPIGPDIDDDSDGTDP